ADVEKRKARLEAEMGSDAIDRCQRNRQQGPGQAPVLILTIGAGRSRAAGLQSAKAVVEVDAAREIGANERIDRRASRSKDRQATAGLGDRLGGQRANAVGPEPVPGRTAEVARQAFELRGQA